MKWGRGSGKGREMTTTETCSCYLAFINPAVFLPSSHSGALLHYGDLSFYGGTSHTEVYSSCGGSECGCMSARDTFLTHSPSSPGLCRRSNHGPLLPPQSRGGSRERYVQEAPRKSGSSRMGTPGALLIVLLLQATLGITGAKAPPENVETMATWTTQLPCRVRSTDTPQLVLWYRRHENHPFYSYDARNGNLSAGSGRVHDNVLGPRSQFLLVKKTYQPGPQDPPGALPVFPGWLELQQVTREDAGGFTCRVDFLDAPTQTHRLHLIVNEKPSTVMVVDGQGRTLPRGPSGVLVAGPFNQGSRPFLTCYVRGGWPVPSIEWVKGGVRLTNASTSVSGGDGSLTNRLYLPPLTAADYLTELQCVVTNNNLTEPIITSVRIDINIKPASVLITGVESALETGKRQEVKCVSTGSRPPANLTWNLKGEADWSPLQVTQTVTRTGSSESRVVWAIQPGDNGRELSCTATNPRNPEYAVTNRTLLTVFHHPIVSLSIGRGLDPSSIKEGGDVYFTCSVTANPPPSGITFYHQGEEVQQGRRGAGVVLVTGDSLVLQKVGRGGGGLYSCSAANARGNETSNVIHLHVLYAPQCEVEEQVVTVTPGENVTVVCTVDAYPPPDRFSWSLNSTQDGLHVVPQNEFEWSGNTSRFTYTTSVSLSKMMVLCWAMNTQGRTGHPCTTTLIPAGMPERVQSCTVVEQRISSLKVTCTPGFDGGLRQRFIATVLEPGDKRIVANVTADEPQFTLGGLAPGFDYVVKVFAFNSRGRSEPYILDGFSLKVAENRMDSGNVGPSQGASPLLALFIGVLAAFMLTLTVIIVATKLRCRVRASSRGGAEGGKSEESEDDDESRGGNKRRSSAEEKLMTMRTPDCEERAKGTLSPPQQQQQQQQQLSQQPPQQIQQQQQQHFFGAHRSHDIGSPLDYTRLDSKTSDSLYSSCASNRCGIGYSTESAMLLSSSPSACSATIGMLVGPPCPSGADVPAVGSGPMMGIMYGSLGRSLGQTWGQYSSLSRPPPPAYDAEVGQRFHTLSAGSPCTRRPSESFV